MVTSKAKAPGTGQPRSGDAPALSDSSREMLGGSAQAPRELPSSAAGCVCASARTRPGNGHVLCPGVEDARRPKVTGRSRTNHGGSPGSTVGRAGPQGCPQSHLEDVGTLAAASPHSPAHRAPRGNWGGLRRHRHLPPQTPRPQAGSCGCRPWRLSLHNTAEHSWVKVASKGLLFSTEITRTHGPTSRLHFSYRLGRGAAASSCPFCGSPGPSRCCAASWPLWSSEPPEEGSGPTSSLQPRPGLPWSFSHHLLSRPRVPSHGGCSRLGASGLREQRARAGCGLRGGGGAAALGSA
ncbi:uncharacterized protein LOC121479310 [Vulpes lagopus]|uniref:uncharacterized protein LOC121479310 n=1 Tax=Vulpes lagopus TaxID=494514 RepID=UPI001BC9EB77|nr:uncharacterized protein LOC121479310 [Vulpes lagopus]